MQQREITPSEPASLPHLSEREAKSFWELVQESSSDACWEWAGPRDAHGYGRHAMRSTRFRAHRVAYALTNGCPDGFYVLHRCDNPPCCNPAHLFLGSFQDNMDDRTNKQRAAKGEEHGCDRLPERRTLEIIAAHYEMGLRVCDVAALFGERRQLISRIVRGDRWAYLRLGDSRDRRHTASDETVRNMRAARWSLGLSTRDVSRMFGQPLGSTEKLVHGLTRAKLGGVPTGMLRRECIKTTQAWCQQKPPPPKPR